MESITEEERAVLELIRSKKFQNITIQVNDGKIVLIRREETIKPGHFDRKQAHRHEE
ncbi:MAG: hypothetical protein HY920_02970 [Elusimicrobia bacterium]|nr:hypothetical protein [Elusimicrobiota bacterium]